MILDLRACLATAMTAVRSAAMMAVMLSLAACSRSTEPTLALARAGLEAKNYDHAILTLKSLLQTDASSTELRLLLAQAYVATNNHTAANVELRKALELGHARDEVVPLLAKSMLATGQARQLVEEFRETTLGNSQAQADLKTSLATAYFALKRSPEAIAAIEQAFRAQPNNPDTALLQARHFASLKRYADALALVDGVIAARPADAQAWQQRGDLLLQDGGNAAGAVEAYRKALSHDSRHIGASSNLIAVLIMQGDVKAARAQLVEMRKFLPNNPQTMIFEAHVALLEKNPKRARELADQVLRVAPENLAVLQLSANIDLATGATLRAERALSKLLSLAPDQRLARNQLAAIQLGHGQPERALVTLKPLFDSGDADARSHAVAGMAQIQDGNLDDAISSFNAAARLNPKDPSVKTHLALAQLNKAGFKTTVAELQRIAAADKGQVADLALVGLHLRAKDFAAALKAVDALQLKETENPSTAMLRGRIQLKQPDLSAARSSFERALKLDPGHYPAAAMLAGMDLDEKLVESAKRRFENLLTIDPKNVQAMLGLAKIHAMEGGNNEDLTRRLSEAVKVDPGEPTARLALVQQLLNQRSVKSALAAAQDAVAALPENADLMDALGRAQMLAGDNNQAIGAFTRLAALEPHSARAYLRISGVHLASGNPRAAEQVLRRALTITPNLLDAQQALARIALKEKRPQDALRIARTVQRQRPKEAVGYLMEGDLERSRKNLTAEIVIYQEGIRQATVTELAKKLYSVLQGAKRTAEAEKLAADWLSAHAQDAEFRAFLGDIAMAKGNYDVAEQRFRSVLALHPRNALAMNNIAWIYTKQGKTAAAIEFAEKALALHPKAPGIMDTLASALAADKQLSKAIEVQSAALALSPGSPELRLNLAKLHLEAGNKAAARADLEALDKLGTRFSGQAEVKRLMGQL